MVYVMLFFNKGVGGDGDAFAERLDLEPRLLLTSEDLFLKIADWLLYQL